MFAVSVSPVVSTYLMLRHPYYLETKRYNICQGREEAYLYQDLDFYNDNFVGPLNRISMTDPTRCGDPRYWYNVVVQLSCSRWILNLLYYTYIIIVPYCYVQIYRFRNRVLASAYHIISGHKDNAKGKKYLAVSVSLWPEREQPIRAQYLEISDQ